MKKLPFWCLACFSATLAAAQNRPTVSANGSIASNPYDFPIEVLVVHDSSGALDKFQSLAIGAGTSVRIDMPAGSRVETFTPLDPEALSKRLPACAASAGGIRLTPALVNEEMALADQGGVNSVASKRLEDLAQKEGAIELAQNLDEAKVRRNDPVIAELRSEQFRDSDPATREQMIQQDKTDQINSMVETAVYYAAANGEVMRQHDDNASIEAGRLEEMVSQKQNDLAKLDAAYAAENTQVAAGRDFNAHSAGALAQSASFRYPARLSSPVEVGRVCGGAANDQDFLAVRAPSDLGVSTMLGSAAFDRGGSEDIVLRRIAGTSQWIATFYWPLESSKASIKLRVGSKMQQVGSIATGRSSVQQQMETARKAVNSLKSRYRGMEYSSKGGDEVKTTIIP